MACSDVKLACCRLCGKAIASDLGACIHCGVCKPIKKDTMPWWQKALLVMIVSGTILATLRYETAPRIDPGFIGPDCRLDETGYSPNC